MSQSIGIIELNSIAKGMEICDLMLKSANVELLVSKTLCPGKFLLMISGDVAAVTQSIQHGTQHTGHLLVDSVVLPNIHPAVLPALSGLNPVEQRQAVGIVETWSAAACISAADRAVKAARITLVRIHMAFGIGGKCYQVMSGEIGDVQNALAVANQTAGENGLLICSSMIPRPHHALWQQLIQGA